MTVEIAGGKSTTIPVECDGRISPTARVSQGGFWACGRQRGKEHGTCAIIRAGGPDDPQRSRDSRREAKLVAVSAGRVQRLLLKNPCAVNQCEGEGGPAVYRTIDRHSDKQPINRLSGRDAKLVTFDAGWCCQLLRGRPG